MHHLKKHSDEKVFEWHTFVFVDVSVSNTCAAGDERWHTYALIDTSKWMLG